MAHPGTNQPQTLKRHKSGYFEMLADMNAQQVVRLTEQQVAAFNQAFQEHQEVLDYFGYSCAPSGNG